MSKKKIIIFITALFFVAVVTDLFIHYFNNHSTPNPAPSSNSLANGTNNNSSSASSSTTPATQIKPVSLFAAPISRSKERITKKPFGIYITPTNSPVQPERFTGYHTGVDFETFGEEQNIDVPINAICDGPMILKEWASGYGGVAVQACKLDGEDITVVYGHLKLASITAQNSEQLSAGQQIGVLGKGYSQETDGERKHLHLGIHRGSAVNILGYVQNKSELENWIDIEKYL